MQKYVIRDYHQGVEPEQARIGIELARKWVWPFAYDLEDLLAIHAQPNFDPAARNYCYLGDEMVGFIVSLVASSGEGEVSTANLDFPRLLPGHEQAAELLIEYALEALKKRGLARVAGRVTTMCPDDIRLAEKMGFAINDWGYKVYYSYEMDLGKLDIPANAVEEIDPEKDLAECAKLATHWYKRPVEWCLTRIQEHYARGIIAHLGVREQESLIAGCLTAPNDVRPATGANFYIHAPDEHSLKPLLAKAVSNCVDHGTKNIIADLINEHLQFEPLYQELGFKKVAVWARCEKNLA